MQQALPRCASLLGLACGSKNPCPLPARKCTLSSCGYSCPGSRAAQKIRPTTSHNNLKVRSTAGGSSSSSSSLPDPSGGASSNSGHQSKHRQGPPIPEQPAPASRHILTAHGNLAAQQQQNQAVLQSQDISPAYATREGGAADGGNTQETGGGGSFFHIRPMYVVAFCALFLGGVVFASLTLHYTANLELGSALMKVLRRIFRSIAFRQLVVITSAILLVRFGLNAGLKQLARWSAVPVNWDKTRMYYILREVYAPLELLLFVAGCCTIADSFVPQLIAVPKATVTQVVKVILSMSFIIGAATVIFNLKSRFCKENAWQAEMKGDITAQRRWEAYDKLGTFAIYAVSVILGIQGLGLEVSSVLAIGGIGGLAIGLAGREICENLLNGFLIMSTSPFEVGDEVMFRPNGQVVEGLVMDIGWYRTAIRSFEREVFVIPNAVFSKNVVLNVTRKLKEWRFYEFLSIRVQDVQRTNTIIQDMRRIIRNDVRIMNKLHRRAFLDKITREDIKIYISFYVEAATRDQFMAVKQDLLLAFVDCVERNGAKLAVPRTVVDMEGEASATMGLLGSAMATQQRMAGVLPEISMEVVEQVDVSPEVVSTRKVDDVAAVASQQNITSAAPTNVSLTKPGNGEKNDKQATAKDGLGRDGEDRGFKHEVSNLPNADRKDLAGSYGEVAKNAVPVGGRFRVQPKTVRGDPGKSSGTSKTYTVVSSSPVSAAAARPSPRSSNAAGSTSDDPILMASFEEL